MKLAAAAGTLAVGGAVAMMCLSPTASALPPPLVPPGFEASAKFQGPRDGFTYRDGPSGRGYYLDTSDAGGSSAGPEPAGAPAKTEKRRVNKQPRQRQKSAPKRNKQPSAPRSPPPAPIEPEQEIDIDPAPEPVCVRDGEYSVGLVYDEAKWDVGAHQALAASEGAILICHSNAP